MPPADPSWRIWLSIIADVLSIIGAIFAALAWWRIGKINTFYRSRILVSEVGAKVRAAVKNARKARKESRWQVMRAELTKAEVHVDFLVNLKTSLTDRASEVLNRLRITVNSDDATFLGQSDGCITALQGLVEATELFAKDKEWEGKS